jgi:hypothetical protein
MPHYIVSIYSHMDGDNRTFMLHTDNEADACKQAILNHCDPKYRDIHYGEWVKEMGNTFEEIAVAAAQGELVLSSPFSIDSLLTLSKAK